MKRNAYGFTIVELLIVIVVVGILAIVSAVAYTGVQQRARYSRRLSDAQQIIRAIEAYRAVHGVYPSSNPFTQTATCVAHNNGYLYSTATDGRWMQNLISSGIISSVPVAPGNDCTSFYRYIKPSPAGYGCTERTKAYAVFEVHGTEGMARPSNAVAGTWRPCEGATASWGSSSVGWVFVFEAD